MCKQGAVLAMKMPLLLLLLPPPLLLLTLSIATDGILHIGNILMPFLHYQCRYCESEALLLLLLLLPLDQTRRLARVLLELSL